MVAPCGELHLYRRQRDALAGLIHAHDWCLGNQALTPDLTKKIKQNRTELYGEMVKLTQAIRKLERTERAHPASTPRTHPDRLQSPTGPTPGPQHHFGRQNPTEAIERGLPVAHGVLVVPGMYDLAQRQGGPHGPEIKAGPEHNHVEANKRYAAPPNTPGNWQCNHDYKVIVDAPDSAYVQVECQHCGDRRQYPRPSGKFDEQAAMHLGVPNEASLYHRPDETTKKA